jgi:hypothetical protein
VQSIRFVIVVALTVCLATIQVEGSVIPENNNQQKLRLIVSTDISTLTNHDGEPDDTQSMVRLLLYSNDFDIEGLIASQTKHDGNVHPDYITHLIRQYGRVRDNLALHDPTYPTEQRLLALVKAGSPERDSLGEWKDTEGSNWIISVVDKPDLRPVWITIWGGSRELAQALWKVQQTRTPDTAAGFRSKIRVYAIGDQDTTGKWIKSSFPDLFYITDYKAFRGMYRDGDTSLAGSNWVETNVTNSHGALGAAYPNYDGGDPWGKVQGVKEGDTPSFLYLVPNGLGDPAHPEWGSWGGRFAGFGSHYAEAKDTVSGDTSKRVTVYRWRPAYQADFQARLDWCVKPYTAANHQPLVTVKGKPERGVTSGEVVTLDATGSSDPDGNKLYYNWSVYREPSSYDSPLVIEGNNKRKAKFIAPSVDSPKTIHIILTMTDDGKPSLCAYKRVVVTISPKKR